MHSFRQVKILPYNKQDLFNLVLDVESYPEFLPWCQAARIISRNEQQMIAELVVQFKGFSEKYQSRIVPRKSSNNDYIIEVEAISGPFKYLKNYWQFSDEASKTKVEFTIELEFNSIFLAKLMSLFFTNKAEKMIKAFEDRASVKLKNNFT